jgi:pseudouridylate synthase
MCRIGEPAPVSRGFSGLLVLDEDVERALIRSQPVVALETSLVAHGLPHPLGIEVARSCEERVRAAGAVPATVAILDGAVRVGLRDADLVRLATSPDVRKVGPRDLASCVIGGGLGATTVGGTLAACRIAGIHFMATGGIGGVHRGWAESRDVSADLYELAIAAVCVVCSGAKSILDIPATLEEIETNGIPLIGYRTDTLPLFYQRESEFALADRADDAASIAAVAAAHWGFARTTGVLVANPVAADVALAGQELEPAIASALDEAAAAGIRGGAVTPFVLSRLHDITAGRTLAANRRLVEDNATLAAEIAACYFLE